MAHPTSVRIDMDPLDGSHSPPPASPSADMEAQRKSSAELWVPVIYQSLAFEVQNELDRMAMERQDGQTSPSVGEPMSDDEEAYKIVAQTSLRRKQSRDLQRKLSSRDKGAKCEPKIPLPSTVLPPTRKKTSMANFKDRVLTMRRSASAGVDVVKEATQDDHMVPLDILEKRYDTHMHNGLTDDQVSVFQGFFGNGRDLPRTVTRSFTSASRIFHSAAPTSRDLMISFPNRFILVAPETARTRSHRRNNRRSLSNLSNASLVDSPSSYGSPSFYASSPTSHWENRRTSTI